MDHGILQTFVFTMILASFSFCDYGTPTVFYPLPTVPSVFYSISEQGSLIGIYVLKHSEVMFKSQITLI